MFCFLSIHGLNPICLMTIRFLFRPFGSPAVVCLEFPTSASSPTSHREVATSPLMNCTRSSSNDSVFQLHCVMIHLPTQWSNQTSNFMCCSLFSLQIRFLIGRNLRRQLWSPQILQCSLLSCGWLAWPSARDERWFSLSFAGHTSCNVWNCSFSCQIFLPPNMPLIFR